jgi:hypothetical protein
MLATQADPMLNPSTYRSLGDSEILACSLFQGNAQARTLVLRQKPNNVTSTTIESDQQISTFSLAGSTL